MSQGNGSWHVGCFSRSSLGLVSPFTRRRIMRIFLGILTLLSAFLLASLASASQLDYQPGLIGQPTQYKDFDSHQTLLENSAGPIRHRRPYRDRERNYDDGYRSQPEYWAMLGAGAFDPTDQPGNGLYVNGGFGATMNKQIDLGVQVSWYHHSTNGEEFVREGNLPDGTHVRTV